MKNLLWFHVSHIYHMSNHILSSVTSHWPKYWFWKIYGILSINTMESLYQFIYSIKIGKIWIKGKKIGWKQQTSENVGIVQFLVSSTSATKHSYQNHSQASIILVNNKNKIKYKNKNIHNTRMTKNIYSHDGSNIFWK